MLWRRDELHRSLLFEFCRIDFGEFQLIESCNSLTVRVQDMLPKSSWPQWWDFFLSVVANPANFKIGTLTNFAYLLSHGKRRLKHDSNILSEIRNVNVMLLYFQKKRACQRISRRLGYDVRERLVIEKRKETGAKYWALRYTTQQGRWDYGFITKTETTY